VRLRVAVEVELAVDRVVLPAGDDELLGRELRDDLAPRRGDDDIMQLRWSRRDRLALESIASNRQ